MPDTSRESLINRLKGLEALRRGAQTEHEAALCADKIKGILDKYNLEAGVLDVPDEQASVEMEPEANLGVTLHASDAILATSVDLMMDTLHYVAEHGRRFGAKKKVDRMTIVFVGLRSNVEAAVLTFTYLRDCVLGLLEKRKRSGDVSGKRECSSYRLGAAKRIYDTCTALKKQPADENCRALVHLGNSVAKRHMDGMQFEREFAPNLEVKDNIAACLGYVDGKAVDPRGAKSKRLNPAPQESLF